jgi:hypothetical protein
VWSCSKAEWEFTVDVCEKGKRTWIPPYDGNDYQFRKLNMEQRTRAIREKSLMLASPAEIQLAMLELWETLRPDTKEFNEAN